MKVGLHGAFNDAHGDGTQSSSQRQLALSVTAVPGVDAQRQAPLNLCLVLDYSGSMNGAPLQTVQQAAYTMVDQLRAQDCLSVVGFNHQAHVLVDNQPVAERDRIKGQISRLRAKGGTAIDEGLKVGIEEVAKGKEPHRISQIFLLTDGENEHGDNDRCLKLSTLAADYNLTLSTLGFGDHWNQDVLEQLADAGGGSLSYIQSPDEAMAAFSRLFDRVQSVGLTNAYLHLDFAPGVRLAEFKPMAQVAPETVELSVTRQGNRASVRLGDLMVETPRVVLVNLYIEHLSAGQQAVVQAQVQYDVPAQGLLEQTSEPLPLSLTVQSPYEPAPDEEVQHYVWALAKYRQTQIAEQKLQQGDHQGAATLLQSAAQTALQMGDSSAATVLQDNATRLQAGQDLSERDRKQTRIVSKTRLQSN